MLSSDIPDCRCIRFILKNIFTFTYITLFLALILTCIIMTIVCLAFTFFAMLHIHTSLQINTFSALYKSAFSVEIAFHSFKFTTVFTNYYDRTRVEQKNTTAKTNNWKFHRSSILGSVKQVLLKRLKKEIRGKFFYNTNEKRERERYELVWNETSRTGTIKTWMRAWAKRYINTSIIHTHPHPNIHTYY